MPFEEEMPEERLLPKGKKSVFALAVILFVLGGVATGVFFAYSVITDNFKALSSADLARHLASSVTSLYAHTDNYQGLSLETLHKNSALPASLYDPKTKILRPYADGEIDVFPVKEQRRFSIRFSLKSGNACIKIAYAPWNETSGFESLAIGQKVFAVSPAGREEPYPPALEQVLELCRQDPRLTWTFK